MRNSPRITVRNVFLFPYVKATANNFVSVTAFGAFGRHKEPARCRLADRNDFFFSLHDESSWFSASLNLSSVRPRGLFCGLEKTRKRRTRTCELQARPCSCRSACVFLTGGSRSFNSPTEGINKVSMSVGGIRFSFCRRENLIWPDPVVVFIKTWSNRLLNEQTILGTMLRSRGHTGFK